MFHQELRRNSKKLNFTNREYADKLFLYCMCRVSMAQYGREENNKIDRQRNMERNNRVLKLV